MSFLFYGSCHRHSAAISTAEDGLDPNKWFGNVELEVAPDIGHETVTHLGNIYKYYRSVQAGDATPAGFAKG